MVKNIEKTKKSESLGAVYIYIYIEHFRKGKEI